MLGSMIGSSTFPRPLLTTGTHVRPRYTAAISLHQSIIGLESFHVESENELQLVYKVTTNLEPHELKVKLLFVRNTRQLADAEIIGIGEGLSHLVDLHVRSNDAPGLLVAAL